MSNSDVSRRMVEDVWNKGDYSVIDEFLSPDFVAHDPLAGDQHGSESQMQFVQGMKMAFPDVQARVLTQREEGDKVFTEVEFQGTHAGPLYTPDGEVIAPTNNEVTVYVNVTDLFEDGVIVESWADWNPNHMFSQLGL